MRVTIEGDLDQIASAMNFPKEPTQRQVRIAESKSRREKLVERRRVVVQAFKLARKDGKREQMDRLLEAIRRIEGVTDADIDFARQVLAHANHDHQ